MKAILSLILLPLFPLSASLAQGNLPSVYEIETDTALYTWLPASSWQILEDKNGELDFNAVTTEPLSGKFHNPTTEGVIHDPTVHGYWFRYVLANAMDRDAEICLGDTLPYLFRFFTPNNEQSDYYLFDESGKVTHYVNGLLTPWSKLDGFREIRIIPIVLKPHERVIIYRRTYNAYKLFPAAAYSFQVGFASTKKITALNYDLLESHYFKAILNSFLFGVLIFAGVFIYFFFVIVRERVYLYFSFTCLRWPSAE